MAFLKIHLTQQDSLKIIPFIMENENILTLQVVQKNKMD